jgi:predicted ArsR family transcriptional regulator
MEIDGRAVSEVLRESKEKMVLAVFAKPRTADEAAEFLGVTTQTVRKHIQRFLLLKQLAPVASAYVPGRRGAPPVRFVRI